ncbi:unnamed protein product [Periconia digitata]|uniref:Uncharacterized protein n=1 Tax=Periconia digitata TaxID=1303443 RepID=A0A9W4XTJ4_9PLEO|nr:unnamed protein product [Periconia digitata]
MTKEASTQPTRLIAHRSGIPHIHLSVGKQESRHTAKFTVPEPPNPSVDMVRKRLLEAHCSRTPACRSSLCKRVQNGQQREEDSPKKASSSHCGVRLVHLQLFPWNPSGEVRRESCAVEPRASCFLFPHLCL